MAKDCSNSSCTRESREGCPSKAGGQTSFLAEANEGSDIKKVIGIVSGKGGVGKSFVTASLANSLAAMGKKVGILDGDITGPSIAKMYGLHGPVISDGESFEPMETVNGIKVMSINFLLPDEEDPVIWRGPVIGGVVKQFWTDVAWGELDVLLVDMPPGTGDVPLTVFQSLPVDGILVVTSPQDLVRMIVTKAYNMAAKMNIPVMGIVENYSYLTCPDCGKKISIFGESHVDDVAASLGVPVLGKLPLISSYAACADEGDFDAVLNEALDDAAVAVAGLL